MKRKFLLLTLMCILGGLSSSLWAQFDLTYNQGTKSQYTLTFTPIEGNECAVQMKKGNGPSEDIDMVIPATVEYNNTTYTVVKIPNNAFSGASTYLGAAADYFTSLTIPNTVTTISSNAFKYWVNCTTVTLGEGVTSISNNAFANSTAITTIYCYAETPPTCGGNAVFTTTVRNSATVYVPANSIDNYKKETTSGYGWAYIATNNFKAISSTPTAPDAPTLNSPDNGSSDIFNPNLNFTLGKNTTHYQISIAEVSGTNTGDYTDLTPWVKKSSNDVSYQTSDLKSNTTYLWKVVARNGEDSNALTAENVASFTTKEFSAPGQIEDAYPDGQQNLVNPTFTWTFGSDTEEYQILIDNAVVKDWTNPGADASGSYQTSGLSAGEHTWRIDAKNSVGTTIGTEYSFTVASLPDNVTPVSPADGATGVTSNVIKFQFAEGTTDYRLLYGETVGELAYCGYGTAKDWLQTNGVTEIEIEAPYFSFGKTYYWAVDVKNTIGKRSVHQNVEGDEEVAIYSFTVANTLPVTNTYPANGEANLDNPTLTWKYNGDATHYQVYFGTENSLEAKGWMERAKEGTGLVPNGSFTTSNLEGNTTYFWRVDVKDANGNVYKGETWSFTSKLPVPQNVTATPAQVKPTFSTFGATRISWNTMNGVQGYDVYLGTQKLNAKIIPANKNYYDIEANLSSMILDYNMDPGHSIYVYAVYESGVSMSEAVIVKVTGTGLLDATVIEDINGDKVAGATITLTQTEDEFGNTENLDVVYTFTTNESGNLSIGESAGEKVLNGTYTINVTKENYIFEGSETVVIKNNATTKVELEISPNIPGDVTPVTPVDEATNVTSKTIKFAFAEGTEAYRFLYGETDKLLGEQGMQSMGYYINGKTDNTATWVKTNGATEAEVEIPYISAGKTHYWAIEVENAVGYRLFFGAPNVLYKDVAVYSFTANETLPVFNTAPANGATNLDDPELSWKYNGDATHYQVYLGTDANNLEAQGWIERATEGTGLVSTGSFLTADLNERTTYYWRVDVKDANEVVYEGETWSFVSTLPAPVATANPTQIVPSSSMTYGETTISWEALEGVQGYNVYLGTEKLKAEILSAETTEYTIAANTLKLTHNMENGYDIYVEAVYELGNSMSEAVNVKVTGSGFLNAKIVKDFNTNLGVDGAKITLKQLEDEFGNVYDGDGVEREFTTDDNGNLNNESVFNGKYAVTVSRKYYETYEGTIEFKQGETTDLNVTLVADPANVFEVYTIEKENTFNSINVYLDNINWEEAPAGYYNVYLKNGEEVTEIGSEWFIATNNAVTSVYFTYTGWAKLSNGSYQFGVAKVEDQINWSEAVTRNYDIFNGEDSDWNNPESWKDGVVPGEDAKVHILKSVIINDTVKVNTVTIEDKGSLTINGSLTAEAIYNNVAAKNLCLNDGGQLRYGNVVNGVFNMNVAIPTKWNNTTNKDGWQFISSPFTDARVEAWTNSGKYDFYRYDGKEELEWINHKKEQSNFEKEFTPGVGYLASQETLEEVTLSGALNNAVSHKWEFTYNEDKDLANFYLLGNPFTFNMDMSAATYNNLVEGVAIVNAEGGYTYVGANQDITTIPVGDGFFVKVKEKQNATDEISLLYGTRSSREKSANINLVATSKAGKDNVVINFAGQSEGFNKLQNFNDEIATVCVVENGKAYGIYNCESDVNEIEVMFSAKQMGSYSLSFELNGEFESAVLVDRLTGVETDMIAEGEYNFIASSEDMKNRFVVRFANGQSTTANSQFVYQSGDELIINAEGAIEIIDMMGRVVYSSEMNNGRVDVSNFNNAAYVVRALNEGKVQKVVIY